MMENEYFGDTDNAKNLKPVLYDLIQYYYMISPDNGCGGILHVVLDDGNLDAWMIVEYMKDCEKAKDSLGYLICDVMLQFTTEELENMYEIDFWGMKPK